MSIALVYGPHGYRHGTGYMLHGDSVSGMSGFVCEDTRGIGRMRDPDAADLGDLDGVRPVPCR